ncbi:Asp/Glu racemase [Photobacterium sp. MCCC 1A19761]|uniref:maleate cis-trans isomerase family protein n=1 Tax=Photobacterium sp. MCCC 1A19761 TaxID=3115000 RepID=UPI00307DCBB8
MRNERIEPHFALEHLAPAGRIGVITLATDFNIEQDLRRLYPETVHMFTSRVRNVNPLTIENLRTMAPGITAAADAILPGTRLDAMIYACTSGTIAIGQANIAARIHQACPGTAVTDPVTAVFAALATLRVKRLSILTPYTDTVNHDVAAYFHQQGYEVTNIAGFGFEDDTAMTFIDPRDIKRAALRICDPNADALFISCTALRATPVIAQIEAALGKPVLSSNQVLAWHSLKLVGYAEPIHGFGLLMERHLGAPAETQPSCEHLSDAQ